MPAISHVAHVVLAVRDPQASAEWYSKVLGMEIMTYSPEIDIAFVSFGKVDHDLGFIRAPEDAVLGSLPLSHIALLIEGGEEELSKHFRNLLDHGIEVEFFSEHGLSKGFYFFDPDGYRLELFFKTMNNEDGMKFMREVGAVLEPYELEPAPRA